ncbi:MAG: beta-galactosidase [Defluviitaleaceae bacterium]|nr:beta-galactosidase [Defluviitaleaceae bacterium]
MIYYGADYYPEQETEQDIGTDISLMVDAGFNAVRMGEFAWIKFEPREGEYDFAWFDSVISRLGEKGIFSLVCTPTACPPVWMIDKHPDILYTDGRGVVRPFGGRRHYCYNNAAYREYSEKIAEETARRYGNNKNVIGFHIDNELAQEGTGRCQCAVCKNLFRGWLEKKYGSIDNLNKIYGTIFWGQTYSRFDQLNPPVKSIEPCGAERIETFFDNPALRLDWERFCSDSIIDFQNIQVGALKRHTDKPVTTNTTGGWTNGVNYYKGCSTLDIVSVDEYPSLRTEDLSATGFGYAFMRGIKDNIKKFWVVESSSGGGLGVWARQGVSQPYPGALTQTAQHAFASGAELLTYFQFRTFRFGAEQLEASVMDIDGIPRRRFKEFQKISAEAKKWTDLLESSSINNETAICFDYDCLWATAIKPFNAHYHYTSYCAKLYRALAKNGIGTDVIPMDETINKYKFVILPAPIIMDCRFKKILGDYVKNGGVVLSTFLTAIKDENNSAPRERVPAGLTELFGITVAEGDPVFDKTRAQVEFSILFSGKPSLLKGANELWTESLEINTANVIGRYADTFRAGEPFASRNDYGKGTAYYVGAGLDDSLLAALTGDIAARHGLEAAPFALKDGMEAVRRVKDGENYYFVFNFNEKSVSFKLDRMYTDAFTGEAVSEDATLAAKECIVIT